MATQDTTRQFDCALVGSWAKNSEIFYIICVHKIPILQLPVILQFDETALL